jgi:hypothetical protein
LNRPTGVLTDYHLHLRPDDLDASADDYFSEANVERYRTAASERGIAELGVSEHIYRFEQALDVWQHPFWVPFARDDLDAYCTFVSETCGSASRPTSCPAPRTVRRICCKRTTSTT